jgi:hypothetical protein
VRLEYPVQLVDVHRHHRLDPAGAEHRRPGRRSRSRGAGDRGVDVEDEANIGGADGRVDGADAHRHRRRHPLAEPLPEQPGGAGLRPAAKVDSENVDAVRDVCGVEKGGGHRDGGEGRHDHGCRDQPPPPSRPARRNGGLCGAIGVRANGCARRIGGGGIGWGFDIPGLRHHLSKMRY